MFIVYSANYETIGNPTIVLTFILMRIWCSYLFDLLTCGKWGWYLFLINIYGAFWAKYERTMPFYETNDWFFLIDHVYIENPKTHLELCIDLSWLRHKDELQLSSSLFIIVRSVICSVLHGSICRNDEL